MADAVREILTVSEVLANGLEQDPRAESWATIRTWADSGFDVVGLPRAAARDTIPLWAWILGSVERQPGGNYLDAWETLVNEHSPTDRLAAAIEIGEALNHDITLRQSELADEKARAAAEDALPDPVPLIARVQSSAAMRFAHPEIMDALTHLPPRWATRPPEDAEVLLGILAALDSLPPSVLDPFRALLESWSGPSSPFA